MGFWLPNTIYRKLKLTCKIIFIMNYPSQSHLRRDKINFPLFFYWLRLFHVSWIVKPGQEGSCLSYLIFFSFFYWTWWAIPSYYFLGIMRVVDRSWFFGCFPPWSWRILNNQGLAREETAWPWAHEPHRSHGDSTSTFGLFQAMEQLCHTWKFKNSHKVLLGKTLGFTALHISEYSISARILLPETIQISEILNCMLPMTSQMNLFFFFSHLWNTEQSLSLSIGS